jgi:hypothetical protein
MALADVLAAATVRPVVVGWLDFADDPQRGWDGPGTLMPTGTGDDDLDGETFLSAAGAIEISDIKQDQGIGGPVTITFAAGEMEDESIVTQLIVDRRAYLGRRAKFWRMFLNAGESAVLPEYDVLFNGVMVAANTDRRTGAAATIAVTCDQDLQKARTAPLRLIEHQVFYAGDTASSFINDLARGPVAGASFTPNAPSTPPSTEPYPGFNDQFLFPMP